MMELEARPLAPTTEEDPASWCTKKVKTRDSEAVVIETLKVEEEMYVSPKALYKEKLLSMSGVKEQLQVWRQQCQGRLISRV